MIKPKIPKLNKNINKIYQIKKLFLHINAYI
jgi:hypothetical protein